VKTTAQLINSLPWPEGNYHFAVINTRPDSSFLVVYSEVKPQFHSIFHFWISGNGDKATAMDGEETTDWKSAIITREQWLAAQEPVVEQPAELPTAAEVILKLPKWPENTKYAVVSHSGTGVWQALFSAQLPRFQSNVGGNFKINDWLFNDPNTYAYKARPCSGWQRTIVEYSAWLAAQPPAQPFPQVGETWQTSRGPVTIVYIKPGDEDSWRCCAQRLSDGSLQIYSPEELSPMATAVDDFLDTVLQNIDEHIQPEDTILAVARLIMAGKLDAELAAMGYVKPEPAKAAE